MNFSDYHQIIDFLSLCLGADTEISLSNGEIIEYIKNPLIESRAKGSPIGEMQKSFFANPDLEDAPYVVNYRALSEKGERLRSSTMFLRDKDGKIKGLITINTKVDELIKCRALIDKIIQGGTQETRKATSDGIQEKSSESRQKDYYETLSVSVTDLISQTIERASQRYDSPPDRFTMKEKIAVVQELDDLGVFLVRGSIGDISRRLNTSEATIYRYLHNLQH